jgi:hypothetical protein
MAMLVPLFGVITLGAFIGCGTSSSDFITGGGGISGSGVTSMGSLLLHKQEGFCLL